MSLMRRTLVGPLLGLVGFALAACLGRAALEPIGPPEDSATGGSAGSGASTGAHGGTGGTSTTSTSSTITTSTTTTQYCDNTGDCQQCTDCAVYGPCEPELYDCYNSNECMEYMDCLETCPGDPGQCMNMCGQSNPLGAQLYYELLYCAICVHCPSDCWEYANQFCFWDDEDNG